MSQADPALELFLRLFSRAGLRRVLEALHARGPKARGKDSPAVAHLLANADDYLTTVDAAVRFLQGRDPGLALRIVGRTFLPEGPRFGVLAQGLGAEDDDPLGWAFGLLGTADRAKHLASLYVDDLADAIREGIAPHFELSRYGERLAASASSLASDAGAHRAPARPE